MKIEQNSRLVFIGDSITDCGRAIPIGEGSGLGNGYVSLVNAFFTSILPGAKNPRDQYGDEW